MEQNEEFIVSALLSELKSENTRKDKTIKALLRVICGCVASLIVVIGGFLWYLNQYDFCSNVIAQDIAPEEIQEILDGADNNDADQS